MTAPIEDCSTGVTNELGGCEPVGSGYNPYDGQPYPSDFPIGDLPDSCVDEWVATGSCASGGVEAPGYTEAIVTVPVSPPSMELPATGPAETVAIGALGSIMIIAGIFIRYLTSASR
jgi:LPXTG-motif cell wall-anchored protein